MIKRERRRRFRQNELIQVVATKCLVAEEVCDVAVEVFLAERLVAIAFVNAAVRIADGCIKRAGCNQLSKLRHLYGVPQFFRGGNGDRIVLRMQPMHDLHRMPRRTDRCRCHTFGKHLHQHFGLIAGQLIRRPCPDVADRHAAETIRSFAIGSLSGHSHIHAIRMTHDAATKLQRSTKADFFERTVSINNPDVSGSCHSARPW